MTFAAATRRLQHLQAVLSRFKLEQYLVGVNVCELLLELIIAALVARRYIRDDLLGLADHPQDAITEDIVKAAIQTRLGVEVKGDLSHKAGSNAHDLVTTADKIVEEVIKSLLSQRFLRRIRDDDERYVDERGNVFHFPGLVDAAGKAFGRLQHHRLVEQQRRASSIVGGGGFGALRRGSQAPSESQTPVMGGALSPDPLTLHSGAASPSGFFGPAVTSLMLSPSAGAISGAFGGSISGAFENDADFVINLEEFLPFSIIGEETESAKEKKGINGGGGVKDLRKVSASYKVAWGDGATADESSEEDNPNPNNAQSEGRKRNRGGESIPSLPQDAITVTDTKGGVHDAVAEMGAADQEAKLAEQVRAAIDKCLTTYLPELLQQLGTDVEPPLDALFTEPPLINEEERKEIRTVAKQLVTDGRSQFSRIDEPERLLKVDKKLLELQHRKVLTVRLLNDKLRVQRTVARERLWHNLNKAASKLKNTVSGAAVAAAASAPDATDDSTASPTTPESAIDSIIPFFSKLSFAVTEHIATVAGELTQERDFGGARGEPADKFASTADFGTQKIDVADLGKGSHKGKEMHVPVAHSASVKDVITSQIIAENPLSIFALQEHKKLCRMALTATYARCMKSDEILHRLEVYSGNDNNNTLKERALRRAKRMSGLKADQVLDPVMAKSLIAFVTARKLEMETSGNGEIPFIHLDDYDAPANMNAIFERCGGDMAELVSDDEEDLLYKKDLVNFGHHQKKMNEAKLKRAYRLASHAKREADAAAKKLAERQQRRASSAAISIPSSARGDGALSSAAPSKDRFGTRPEDGDPPNDDEDDEDDDDEEDEDDDDEDPDDVCSSDDEEALREYEEFLKEEARQKQDAEQVRVITDFFKIFLAESPAGVLALSHPNRLLMALTVHRQRQRQRQLIRQRIAVLLDPIDGTNAFVNGDLLAPLILCGVAVDGIPVAGVACRILAQENNSKNSSTTTASPSPSYSAGALIDLPPAAVDRTTTATYDPEALAGKGAVMFARSGARVALDAPSSVASGIRSALSYGICMADGAVAHLVVDGAQVDTDAVQREASAALEALANSTEAADHEEPLTHRVQLTVAVSSTTTTGALHAMTGPLHPLSELAARGGGNKLLLVAGGAADVFVAPANALHKWDTCAVHAMLRCLGGDIFDVHGRSVIYPARPFHETLLAHELKVEESFRIASSSNLNSLASTLAAGASANHTTNPNHHQHTNSASGGGGTFANFTAFGTETQNSSSDPNGDSAFNETRSFNATNEPFGGEPAASTSNRTEGQSLTSPNNDTNNKSPSPSRTNRVAKFVGVDEKADAAAANNSTSKDANAGATSSSGSRGNNARRRSSLRAGSPDDAADHHAVTALPNGVIAVHNRFVKKLVFKRLAVLDPKLDRLGAVHARLHFDERSASQSVAANRPHHLAQPSMDGTPESDDEEEGNGKNKNQKQQQPPNHPKKDEGCCTVM